MDVRSNMLLLRVFMAFSFCALWIRADVVTDWNMLMIEAIRVDNSAPPLGSRNLAILHTAMYDAVNSIEPTHAPYKFKLEATPGASPEAAAAGAAYAICKSLYRSFNARAHALFSQFHARSIHDARYTNGIAVGNRIAELTLRSRENDGANTQVPYIPSTEPGQWRRTPPTFRAPLSPHWGRLKPFGIRAVDPFMPPPPPSLESPEYAEAVNELKALGGKKSSLRSDEQAEIATFWSDFNYTSTPPGHWQSIAQEIVQERQISLSDSARLFALLSIAQADSAIVCWEAKYRYNFWRPVTAIQRADQDNNDRTERDTAWIPLLDTPPFPSYVSGHSIFSKASAEILTRFFGKDEMEFDAKSDSMPGVVRKFQSFASCADEIGTSRVYGGIHFGFDNVQGKECGRKIGQYIAENLLLPVKVSLPVR
jgi:hypothetical protein